MGFQWSRSEPGAMVGSGLRVHSLAPGKRALVCFLADQNDIWSHSVHWLPEQRKGFPCLGLGVCPVCPMPFTVKHYAPILLYRHHLPAVGSVWSPIRNTGEVFTSLNWAPSILEITQSWADIVHKAQRGACYHLQRGQGGKNSRTAFEYYAKMVDIPEDCIFDVRPQLERVWGVKADAA